MLMASLASGAFDWDTALLIGWVLAAALGLGALWVVVLSDGGAGFNLGKRLLLAVGVLPGIVAAAHWLWMMGTSGHRYEAATWCVWLVLLGGPLVVAGLRLLQLLSWHRDEPA
jgi:hypothetical protein